MNTITAVKGGIGACAIGAALIISTPQAAATPIVQPIGWCPFGHVNPHDPNSACRGSDSAQWPHVPADPNGNPLQKCDPENDGKHVSTEDAVGGRHAWICHHVTNLTGEEFWEWLEIQVQ